MKGGHQYCVCFSSIAVCMRTALAVNFRTHAMHKVHCSIAPISSMSLVGAEHLLLQLQESEGASQEVCRVITREREAWAMRKYIIEGPFIKAILVLRP